MKFKKGDRAYWDLRKQGIEALLCECPGGKTCSRLEGVVREVLTRRSGRPDMIPYYRLDWDCPRQPREEWVYEGELVFVSPLEQLADCAE